MNKNRIDWDWYGTWVIDLLCCNTGNLTVDAWVIYDIWEKAYLAANPQLEEAREDSYMNGETFGEGTTLDLIENHYHQSFEPIYESFVWKIFLILHRPMQFIHSLVRDICSLLRRGRLRHQL
jgi:hypothetical protein